MKPILFNTEMAQAIMEGRKTATRRIVKFIPGFNPQWTGYVPDGSVLYGSGNIPAAKATYVPGDILYVRETWRVQSAHRFGADVMIEFKAGGPRKRIQFPGRGSDSHERPEYDAFINKWMNTESNRWRPSIHMPKEAARLFLHVTDVRVERLGAITRNQVRAEGVPDFWPMPEVYCPQCKGSGLVGTYDPYTLGHKDIDCPYCSRATKRFANLWNSTIKKSDLPIYGWDANPWVWVIEFERCEKPEDKENG